MSMSVHAAWADGSEGARERESAHQLDSHTQWVSVRRASAHPEVRRPSGCSTSQAADMTSNTRVDGVTFAEVSSHGTNIPLYEENGLIGITDGVSVAFSVELNRSGEVCVP